MATEYNITQKQYNGTDYDTLYPETTSQQVLLNDDAISYTGSATVNGALTKQQADITALNSKFSDGVIMFTAVTIGNVTIGNGGYLDISSYYPGPLTNYTYLFASVHSFGTISTKDAINISGDGKYLMGTANAAVTKLVVRYYYRRN